MAEQADAPEREDELQPELEHEGQEPEAHEAEQPTPDPEPSEPEPGDEDDFEISFGDEAAPASRGENSDLVRHLRQEVRKRDEELTAYRAGKIQPPQPQTIDPGPKPTLEDCDYDGDKFEAELLAWNDRKRQADQAQAQVQQETQAAQQAFADRLKVFEDGKAAMKAKDYDIAQAAVVSGLNELQQTVLIKAADDSAKLVYALGRHPGKLAELAKIKDPIEFTKAMVKLEGQLKVTSRRTPPEPDTPVRGAGSFTPKSDPVLERLEREAARTGDRTQVVKYRREQRNKAQSK